VTPSFTSAKSKLFGFNQITGRKLTRQRARDWVRPRIVDEVTMATRSHNAQQQQQRQSSLHEHAELTTAVVRNSPGDSGSRAVARPGVAITSVNARERASATFRDRQFNRRVRFNERQCRRSRNCPSPIVIVRRFGHAASTTTRKAMSLL